MAKNQLFYGDNLDVLRRYISESVDLVYLDVFFNSRQDYKVGAPPYAIFAGWVHENPAVPHLREPAFGRDKVGLSVAASDRTT